MYHTYIQFELEKVNNPTYISDAFFKVWVALWPQEDSGNIKSYALPKGSRCIPLLPSYSKLMSIFSRHFEFELFATT
jgi:hypothetical protein